MAGISSVGDPRAVALPSASGFHVCGHQNLTTIHCILSDAAAPTHHRRPRLVVSFLWQYLRTVPDETVSTSTGKCFAAIAGVQTNLRKCFAPFESVMLSKNFSVMQPPAVFAEVFCCACGITITVLVFYRVRNSLGRDTDSSGSLGLNCRSL